MPRCIHAYEVIDRPTPFSVTFMEGNGVGHINLAGGQVFNSLDGEPIIVRMPEIQDLTIPAWAQRHRYNVYTTSGEISGGVQMINNRTGNAYTADDPGNVYTPPGVDIAGYTRAGGYAPGDEIIFNSDARIFGCGNSSTHSPANISTRVQYAVNGGTIDPDFIFSEVSYVAAYPSGTSTVAVTDHIPQRDGFTFAGWLVEAEEFRNAAVTPSQVGDTVFAGHEFTVTSGGSSVSYYIISLVAQWEAE